MTGSFVLGGMNSSTLSAAENPAEFKVFWETWDLVVAHFVDQDKVDFTAMTYGAIEGMLAVLGDEGHTTFLPPEALAQHESSLEGEFEGIGAYVSLENGEITIVSPIDGSPAEKAGVLPGDVIVAVDGENVEGRSLNEVIGLIRGPADSEVVLLLRHAKTSELSEVAIVRGRIELESVNWTMIPGTDLAYVQITQFAAKTGQELEDALKEIEQQTQSGQPVTGLVLDLRNNPGGYLREAISVGSQFLPRGEIILQEKDASGSVDSFRSRGWGYGRELPVVVLINEGTASAGEIIAGALKENERATLVGETTFGTGTVLNQFNLSDGSAILLGVTNWLTPKGNLIKGQGIAPDVTVELPVGVVQLNARRLSEVEPGALSGIEDRQLREAINLLGGELAPRMPTAAQRRPNR
ncbi:MAG: S41 family peptidase [Caldilineaceae bacterium]|nr:S41 family peptidase [Caldilineaceae bacterium]